MPTNPLPTKLKIEPLVEAVFEIRFTPRMSASNVIPGILFTRITPHPQIERLPVAEIPTEIRANEPNLRFQPLVRMHWGERFYILVGDTTLGLACKIPYPGWTNFKPHIIELLGYLKDSGIVEKIERYSMKCVNIVQGRDLAEQIGRINMNVHLGSYVLRAEPFTVRVEMRHDPLLHLIRLAAPTGAKFADASEIQGILIEIDSVCEHNTTEFNTFINELPSRAEEIHTRTKEIFFELLTKETLAYLEPRYEPLHDN